MSLYDDEPLTPEQASAEYTSSIVRRLRMELVSNRVALQSLHTPNPLQHEMLAALDLMTGLLDELPALRRPTSLTCCNRRTIGLGWKAAPFADDEA